MHKSLVWMSSSNLTALELQAHITWPHNFKRLGCQDWRWACEFHLQTLSLGELPEPFLPKQAPELKRKMPAPVNLLAACGITQRLRCQIKGIVWCPFFEKAFCLAWEAASSCSWSSVWLSLLLTSHVAPVACAWGREDRPKQRASQFHRHVSGVQVTTEHPAQILKWLFSRDIICSGGTTFGHQRNRPC